MTQAMGRRGSGGGRRGEGPGDLVADLRRWLEEGGEAAAAGPLLERVARRVDGERGGAGRVWAAVAEALERLPRTPAPERPVLHRRLRALMAGLGRDSVRARAAARVPTPARAPASAPPAEPAGDWTLPAIATPESLFPAPWTRPLTGLRGVGPRRASDLARLGVRTVGHLLWHLPRRHEDRTQLRPLAMLSPDEFLVVQGQVIEVQESRPRRALHLTRCVLSDGTGTLVATWFNRPFLQRQLPVGRWLVLFGRCERGYGVWQMKNPEFEPIEGAGSLNAGRWVPVYPLTAGLTQRQLRAWLQPLAEELAAARPDPLPPGWAEDRGLIPAGDALRAIHFPRDAGELEAARRRLAYEELLLFQLALARLAVGGDPHLPAAEPISLPAAAQEAFLSRLPFPPTASQRRAIAEVLADLGRPRAMSRLLQGDVGSGKTVVAAAALAAALASGLQAALMVPTEILALQHAHRLRPWLGEERVALLTSSTPAAERRAVLARLAGGEPLALVGTQALIQEEVAFSRLGLVVIDEQHRFGVRQRAALRAKGREAGRSPHLLVMTATPIPRTLALTLYGDLELTVIEELPPGRQPVATHWLPLAERRRAYAHLDRAVRRGEQGYVICPLVEEGEAEGDRRAVEEWADLLAGRFPHWSIGRLHGRLTGSEKERVMADFASGACQVLVATTVVEVGVDVPRATTILIESADRFGLAQLHQLRGRVGRGDAPATCLLLADPPSEEGRRRLQALCRLQDGFAIAEEDLELRGPGEFFGVRQHGLPDLRVADPLRDRELLALARADAQALLGADPELARPEHAGLRRQLAQWVERAER